MGTWHISRAVLSIQGNSPELGQDLYSLFIRKMQDAPPQEVTIVGDDWEEPLMFLDVETTRFRGLDLQCRTGRWVVRTKMLDSMMSLRPTEDISCFCCDWIHLACLLMFFECFLVGKTM